MGQNEVKIILVTDVSGAVTGFKTATGEVIKFDKAAKDVDKAADQAGLSIKRLTTNAVGLTLGFMGIRSAVDVVKKSLDYLGQIETSALGIASSFMTAGQYIDQVSTKALSAQDSLKSAQQDAKTIIEELQVANLQTIATLDQLVNAYQQTLPVAMSKGFNREQVKDFTVAVVQSAGAIGLSLDMIAEETRSLLTATINPRTSRIATVLGLTNEDIRQNSGNAQQLFNFLMNQLDAYRVAGIEAQNTWAGLLSNTKDIAFQIGGKTFQPLFDTLKYEIKNTLDSLISIDEKTKTIKWNPEFIEQINTTREAVISLIAEFYRMGMMLDKDGEILTSIGIIFSAGQSEKMMDWNMMFEKRYQEGEKALENLAMREYGPKTKKEASNKHGYVQNPVHEDEERVKEEKKRLGHISEIQKEAHDRELLLYADKNDKELMLLETKHEKEIEDLKKLHATKAQINELSSRHLREQGEASKKLQKEVEDGALKRFSDIKDSEARWEANMKEGIEERARRESDINKKNLDEKIEFENQQRANREAEINYQLSHIDLLEKERKISKGDAITGRIGETRELLKIQKEHLETLDKENDTTAWYAQADAIQKTNDKLVELNFQMKEQTGSALEGMKYGLDDYLHNVKTNFQQFADIARTAAQSMESAFSDFFFDAMQNKLKTLADYVNSFLLSVQRAIANMMAQQVAQGIVSGVSSYLGSGSTGNGSPLGTDLWGKGGIGTRHEGGQVVYVPKFHLGGLNDDERMVINKVGERYITEEQNAWLTKIAKKTDSPNVNVAINVENQTGMPVNAKQGQVKFDGEKYVIGVILKNIESGGALRGAMGVR